MERRACGALAVVLAILLIPVADRAAATQAAGVPPRPPSHCIFDRMTLHTQPGACRPRAITYPAKVRTAVQRAIYDSSLTFGVPYSILLRLARCESGLNPHANNGTHFGLYQFAPSTFHEGAVQLRSQTGIQARSYWRSLDSAYVAGFMFVTGSAPEWVCE